MEKVFQLGSPHWFMNWNDSEEKLDEFLNIEIQGSKTTKIEMDILNTIAGMLKVLNPSSMEKTMDSYLGTRNMIFASFDVYDNCHQVSEDLMKDIATYARKNLDISKPTVMSTWIEILKSHAKYGVDESYGKQYQSPEFSRLSGRFTQL